MKGEGATLVFKSLSPSIAAVFKAQVFIKIKIISDGNNHNTD
jgi:hypothetical protein